MRLRLLAVLGPYVLGILAADQLHPATSYVGAGAALSGAVALFFGSGRRFTLALASGALGMLSLTLRLNAPAPEVRPGPVPLTLLEAPAPAGFGCQLPVYLHTDRPGRARIYGPEETCAWLPGTRALAHVELRPPAPSTNPGTGDPRRRWARSGTHATGRIVQHRVATVHPHVFPIRAALEQGRRAVGAVLDPGKGEGSSGAILRAIVTGDRSGLTGSAREPFTRSGTAHLLAVSGLHIGWAYALGRLLALGALWVWPSPRVQRMRRGSALGLGLGTAGAYALLVGLSPPTLRAAAMAGVGVMAIFGGRPGASWNALCAAALGVLAVDPASLFMMPFLLSFSAVAGILVWQPSGGPVRRLLGCTLGASIATAPWVVHAGLPLSSGAPVANLVLVPLFGLGVVPLGLLSAVLVPVSVEGATEIAAVARSAVALGETIARACAGPDLLGPSVPALGVGGAAAALLAARAWTLSRVMLARGFAALSIGLSVLALLDVPRIVGPETTEFHFLAVGHGDSTLVRVGSQRWLVDAGSRSDRFDAGRRIVLPVLRAERISRVDVLALTHADRDHVGGARAVIDRLPVGEVWVGVATLEDPAFDPVRRAAARRGVPIRVVSRGVTAPIGSWWVTVLWPPAGYRPQTRNEAGLVLRFEGPSGCALLPADVPGRVERVLADSIRPCTLLKVGHHGSRTSTGEGWLDRVRPDVGIVSGSRSRLGGTGAAEVAARLRRHGVTVYETARFGAIRVAFGPGSPVVGPYLTEPLEEPDVRGSRSGPSP